MPPDIMCICQVDNIQIDILCGGCGASVGDYKGLHPD